MPEKQQLQEDWEKSFGVRVADRVGWVIRNTGFIFLALVQVATLLMFEPFYRVHTGMDKKNLRTFQGLLKCFSTVFQGLKFMI